MRKKKVAKEHARGLARGGPVPLEVRLKIVQAVKRGTRQADVAAGFGVSLAAVTKFLALFEAGGVEALRPRLSGAAATSVARSKAKRVAPAKRHGVVELRKEHPEWGTRRLRDVLARFEGLGVSETTVRRILHEEGLLTEAPPTVERERPPRRFERAEPNQLWQSDIFTFELRRNQRLYVAAFLDDHSRYLVSWVVAHHQRSTLVIEAIERGLADYGEPREVLTDQGRQYTAWRGETDFEQLLRRHGIAHVKSRPQHPQTLGKIERFWKTLWEEFLSRTVFADFADCERRIGLYIQHYNFQRPHQALDGLVPADRFFRAAPHVRAAVEAQVAANALRLAQEKAPQKPFYLVGRLGDQDLSIAATGGALRVQVGDAAQTIPMPKDDDDETQASRIFRLPDEADADEATSAASTPDAAMADRARGSGSGGAAAVPAGALGAVGGEAGDGGDHGAGHLAAALLPAGGEGVARHVDGAGAGRVVGDVARGAESGASAGGAGEPGGAAGAGQAAARAPAVPGEEGAAAGAGGLAAAAWPQAEGAQLGGRWQRIFAHALDDDDRSEPFDPDTGWRDDAVKWRRKLAAADAPVDGEAEEHADGASTTRGRTVELRGPHTDPGGADASGGAGQSRAGWTHDDQRGVEGAGHRAREHADAGAPGGVGGGGGAVAASDGTDGKAIARARAGAGARPLAPPRGEAGGAAERGGSDAGRGGRHHPRLAWVAADKLEAFVGALAARSQGDLAERGPRTTDGDDDADPPRGRGEQDGRDD